MEEEKKEEKELFDFMNNFRETFSRPVKRIRFLGLFDTVNSVPRFESAWMQRSKFPYTARSSAKVIRHAVSIDERRAKFRQDLISGPIMPREHHHRHFWKHYTSPSEHKQAHVNGEKQSWNEGFATPPVQPQNTETHVPDIAVHAAPLSSQDVAHSSQQNAALSSSHIKPITSADDLRGRTFSLAEPIETDSTRGLRDHSQLSNRSHLAAHQRKSSSQNRKQDIDEVWFPGCHADIGGGWEKLPGETWPLSHAPLVWMVREAERAGLRFDQRKTSKLNCCPEP